MARWMAKEYRTGLHSEGVLELSLSEHKQALEEDGLHSDMLLRLQCNNLLKVTWHLHDHTLVGFRRYNIHN
jgi:hypothetical protein